jgi:hypothetical protein
MMGSLVGLGDALRDAKNTPVNKLETLEFLTEKLSILPKDVGNFLTDYFTVYPGEEKLDVFVNGMVKASKVYAPSKAQRLMDMAVSLIYKDIPVISA